MFDDKDVAVVKVERGEGAATIAGGGSLDFMNSGEFRDELRQATAELDSVVVDFREAYFIDTAILAYLAQAAKTLRQRDKRLRVIVRKGSHPERVLYLSSFGQLMDIESEPAETEG
jgi:anti-anti-sigma factor